MLAFQNFINQIAQVLGIFWCTHKKEARLQMWKYLKALYYWRVIYLAINFFKKQKNQRIRVKDSFTCCHTW